MALLPPWCLDSVVAIGVGHDPAQRRWIGTGFIYGSFVSVNQTGEKTYRLWLITNKHVLKDLREIHLKFNSASEPNSKDYPVALTASNGKARWAGHPTEETDVAAIFLNPQFLRTEGRKFEFWRSDEHTYPKSGLKAQEITEGDRVFVLGFPMGLVAADRQYVICRGGVIARIRDFLENKARDFLVDVTVFPGNSGDPQFYVHPR